jgi:hypothetical protein
MARQSVNEEPLSRFVSLLDNVSTLKRKTVNYDSSVVLQLVTN